MTTPNVTLRSYTDADEAAAIALWQRSWQVTYPAIDFAARIAWWRKWWRDKIVAKAQIVVAESDNTIVGFITIEPDTGYLDQIVVAPEAWGKGLAEALLKEAKRIAPDGIHLMVNKDNDRAIAFYRKHGFLYFGEGANPVSGRPVDLMRWRPAGG